MTNRLRLMKIRRDFLYLDCIKAEKKAKSKIRISKSWDARIDNFELYISLIRIFVVRITRKWEISCLINIDNAFALIFINKCVWTVFLLYISLLAHLFKWRDLQTLLISYFLNYWWQLCRYLKLFWLNEFKSCSKNSNYQFSF